MLEEKGFPMQRVDRNVVSAEFRNRERKGERDTDDGTQPKKNGVMHMRTRGEKACSERSEIDEFECETGAPKYFQFFNFVHEPFHENEGIFLWPDLLERVRVHLPLREDARSY